MKITIQVMIEDGDITPQAAAAKVISLERNVEDLRPDTLGLKLDEAKEILAEIQTALVTAQTTRFLERRSSCLECGTPYQKNGTHQLTRAIASNFGSPSHLVIQAHQESNRNTFIRSAISRRMFIALQFQNHQM